jgi:hypothetical protein
MNDDIDSDDLRAAAEMTSEDLHHELDIFAVSRESCWPAWLYRQYHRYRSDVEVDAAMFDRALGAVGDNGPELLRDLYHAGRLDIGFHPGVVPAAWAASRFPEGHELDWWDLFSRAGYTRTGQPSPPAPRPRKPVTVYRGCIPEHRFGMAWTGDIERARRFANDPGLNGAGCVYVVRVLPRAVLAYIDGQGHHKDEYVLDPSPDCLNDNTVIRFD